MELHSHSIAVCIARFQIRRLSKIIFTLYRFEEFQTRIENEPLKLLSYIFEQVEILRLKPSPKHTYVMFPAK